MAPSAPVLFSLLSLPAKPTDIPTSHPPPPPVTVPLAVDAETSPRQFPKCRTPYPAMAPAPTKYLHPSVSTHPRACPTHPAALWSCAYTTPRPSCSLPTCSCTRPVEAQEQGHPTPLPCYRCGGSCFWCCGCCCPRPGCGLSRGMCPTRRRGEPMLGISEQGDAGCCPRAGRWCLGGAAGTGKGTTASEGMRKAGTKP